MKGIRVVQLAWSDGNFVGVVDALVPSDTPILVADQAPSQCSQLASA
jgi:hypothetical protein